MEDPTFLVDSMLGRLARWLVMMGFDAEFAGSFPAPVARRGSKAAAPGLQDDFEIASKARDEGRILLTRDTKMPEFKGLKKLVIREQRFEDQVRRVFQDLHLKIQRGRLFSRCTECNHPLKRVSREEALPKVPEKVRTLETEFYSCPVCQHLYWTGTHVGRTVAKLEEMGLL